MQWMNEPASWLEENGQWVVRSRGQTDFWRITHDGGIRDNGHFFYDSIRGDFDARVCLIGRYQDQFDQAGLMVRVDAANWLKGGIELKDGVQYASAVVTRDRSDWSVVGLEDPQMFWLEIQRRGETFEVLYSLDGDRFQLMRQAYLPAKESVSVGPMIASPIGNGFETRFRNLVVTSL